MSSLFRKEAIEHQHQGLRGEVLVLPRLSHAILVGFIVFWCVLLVIWLSLSSYARKETVEGWIEPSEGVIKVYSEGDGVITDVLIEEGELVEANQALVIVNGDRLLTDGSQLEVTILAEYKKQEALIQAQIQREQLTYVTRRQNLEQQIKTAEQDLDLIENQLITMRKRVELISNQLSDVERLVGKGHATTLEKNQIEEEHLSLVSDFQTLERNKLNQANHLRQLQGDLALMPADQANKMDQLYSDQSLVKTELAKIHAQQAYVIKASKTGIVNNLIAKEGVRPNTRTPLFSLIPADAKLIVHLLLPVRAAGFVVEGQTIDIRYDAFPFQKFGLYSGKITKVSKAVILPAELADSPITNTEPVYKVYAELDSPNVMAFQEEVPLRSGMTLSADIQLENRSIFQWLLEPIFSLRGRM